MVSEWFSWSSGHRNKQHLPGFPAELIFIFLHPSNEALSSLVSATSDLHDLSQSSEDVDFMKAIMMLQNLCSPVIRVQTNFASCRFIWIIETKHICKRGGYFAKNIIWLYRKRCIFTHTQVSHCNKSA